MRFDFSDIPALDGKVAIVTGASSGIGLVTARELAKKHCHVILACRSKTKTEPVIKAIQEAAPNANVEFMELDLMSLKSVQAFTDAFKARGLPLHLLVNNAGIAGVPFALTKTASNRNLERTTLGTWRSRCDFCQFLRLQRHRES
ncbi:unnamed protein product [Aphanomyces euteiches]|uniref:Ketoreductase (KR) domain-containing protein n=1 Tax=Aphanomyces euteiches TaxID=100861 RepID=A0A6G0XFJ2_9STRA|nr:hypothetical protein Ae201684_005332 [Aphanomyces euteiches]KAH9092664.1 hypothetical protein Ae201684P_008334 [Aphanomyces euteiches]KAH9154726.1 hypothetical protein AeRB84_003233 [Aphanomyces euteiches]